MYRAQSLILIGIFVDNSLAVIADLPIYDNLREVSVAHHVSIATCS